MLGQPVLGTGPSTKEHDGVKSGASTRSPRVSLVHPARVKGREATLTASSRTRPLYSEWYRGGHRGRPG